MPQRSHSEACESTVVARRSLNLNVHLLSLASAKLNCSKDHVELHCKSDSKNSCLKKFSSLWWWDMTRQLFTWGKKNLKDAVVETCKSITKDECIRLMMSLGHRLDPAIASMWYTTKYVIHFNTIYSYAFYHLQNA